MGSVGAGRARILALQDSKQGKARAQTPGKQRAPRGSLSLALSLLHPLVLQNGESLNGAGSTSRVYLAALGPAYLRFLLPLPRLDIPLLSPLSPTAYSFCVGVSFASLVLVPM